MSRGYHRGGRRDGNPVGLRIAAAERSLAAAEHWLESNKDKDYTVAWRDKCDEVTHYKRLLRDLREEV